jgi:hypothetical protein
MAVAVRSSTQNVRANGVSSISVTKPTGTADGDLLVAIMGSDPDALSTALTAPAGWTLQGTSPAGGNNTAGFMKFWTHTAASEPSSWTFGTANTSDCHVTVLAITGANNASPIDGSPAWVSDVSSLNTSHVIPTITVSQTNSLRIGATNMIDTSGTTGTTTWTAPAGWTSDSPSPTAASYAQLGVFHKLLTSSGSTGTATATSGTATFPPGEMLLSFAVAANNGVIASGSITPAGTLSKQVRRSAFTGVVTPAGTLSRVRGVARVFSGAITAVGTLKKQSGKVFSGVITPAGTLGKRVPKVFSGVITPAATLKRAFVKKMSGSITAHGSLNLMNAGRVFGRPGLAVITIVKAGWTRARVRRD